jgi:hypothetical protein
MNLILTVRGGVNEVQVLHSVLQSGAQLHLKSKAEVRIIMACLVQ